MTKPLSPQEKIRRKEEREALKTISNKAKEIGKKMTKKIDDEARIEALRELKMYQSADWDLIEETPHYFLIKRNKATLGGHILILLLTGWFTLGIGNLIYHFASIQKKKIIK